MKNLKVYLLLIPFLLAFGKNNKPKTSKYLPKQFVKVPSGKVILGKKIDSCETFYISKTEISNGEWKAFLMDLKQTGALEAYEANRLDSTVWRLPNSFLEVFEKQYATNPAYEDYPLVGVTINQAKAYTQWLTEKHKDNKYGKKITFSIPTKKQWIRAARGESQNTYPWDGPYVRNHKGLYLANFMAIGENGIIRNDETNKLEIDGGIPNPAKEYFTTAKVKSYYPNKFGVYNMAGNVAELISDDTLAMGGSWLDPGGDIRVMSRQSAVAPKVNIGFRVVAVVE